MIIFLMSSGVITVFNYTSVNYDTDALTRWGLAVPDYPRCDTIQASVAQLTRKLAKILLVNSELILFIQYMTTFYAVFTTVNKLVL